MEKLSSSGVVPVPLPFLCSCLVPCSRVCLVSFVLDCLPPSFSASLRVQMRTRHGVAVGAAGAGESGLRCAERAGANMAYSWRGTQELLLHHQLLDPSTHSKTIARPSHRMSCWRQGQASRLVVPPRCWVALWGWRFAPCQTLSVCLKR